MKNRIKVAAIQLNQNLVNRDNLFLKAEEIIKKAVSKGAEFIVFPELFSTGYIPNYSLWERIPVESGHSLK